MLKLSKKVEYGLIFLMHMDSHKNEELASVREISKMYHIPFELLGKVLQSLTRAHLVQSTQGAKGGYRLSRSLEEMTLGDVIEAVEGPVHITTCQNDPACCDQFSNCNIKKPVFHVQKQLLGYMFSLPLSNFRKSQSEQIIVPAEVLTS